MDSRGLSFAGRYAIVSLDTVDLAAAVRSPLFLLRVVCRGASLPPVSYFGKKGGLVMVTLSELIQVGILVVGVIELVLHLIELDRHHRQ